MDIYRHDNNKLDNTPKVCKILVYSAWHLSTGKSIMDTLEEFYEQIEATITDNFDKQSEDIQNKSSDAVVELLTMIDEQRSKAKGNLHD